MGSQHATPRTMTTKASSKLSSSTASFPTITVVHTSDTHARHAEVKAEDVPAGDIYIHSGDFSHKKQWKNCAEHEYPDFLITFNEYLGKLPHKYKIVIAGNHEMGLHNFKRKDIQEILSNAIYLQDTSVELEFTVANPNGSDNITKKLVVYGTPWTTSRNMGFSLPSREMAKPTFDKIPDNVNLLITHLPPYNVLDLAYSSNATDEVCTVCNKSHPGFRHWGNKDLLQRSLHLYENKNLVCHCFGHVHECYDVVTHQSSSKPYPLIFANAAADWRPFRKPLVYTIPLL